MSPSPPKSDFRQAIKDILGYLNFSSGNRDVRFFLGLNTLFETVIEQTVVVTDTTKPAPSSIALQVIDVLENGLTDLAKESSAFRVEDQAGQILKLARDHFLPEYRKFHEELLFHQNDDTIFNSFFLAKVFEEILRAGSPWTESDRIVRQVIDNLNDYIGYRPVPMLEGEEKHQPYSNEWVAAVPLYIRGIGIAVGRYHPIISKAMEILRDTDPEILFEACFNLDKAEEIVLDPRAFDFDHPVNRKPNYHFGLWDPLYIDKEGYYARFVLHQVTLDGILRRIESAYAGGTDTAPIPKDELYFEGGAVLSGTILMGSGVCGDTPSTFSVETELSDLMPKIAAYRDRFYTQLSQKLPKKMAARIEQEMKRLYQPFGGCRQDLNKQLAKRRADQLQRMHLARIYARMGYFDAAKRQTEIISVASSRILTQIDCMITQSHMLIDHQKLEEASKILPEIESAIRRGIACGALVDPWTILGFGGTFTLFYSVENSIRDHRVDDLINILEDIFDVYSRLQKAAAAIGNSDLQADLSDQMSDLAGWWDQYGSTDVSGLDSFSGIEAWESVAIVSSALARWFKAGTAAGDVAFWNRHIERFTSTKAYVLLSEALLDQHDPVASMALMMHWLNQSMTVPLMQGDFSFHSLTMRWIEQVWKAEQTEKTAAEVHFVPYLEKLAPNRTPQERWTLTKKFFDYLEANADIYWSVPEIELSDDYFVAEGVRDKRRRKKKGKNPPDEKDKRRSEFGDPEKDFAGDPSYEDHFDPDIETSRAIDSIYSAAYEDVTFNDTANDGIDGSILEPTKPGAYPDGDDFELIEETERISERLTFIVTIAKLWKYATEKLAASQFTGKDSPLNDEIRQYIDGWLKQALTFREGLDRLLKRVEEYRVPPPRGTSDSLLEYDRHRGTKEILLDRLIWTHVEIADTVMVFRSLLGKDFWKNMSAGWEKSVLAVNAAVFQQEVKEVKKQWGPMLRLLKNETILYVPTSRGGSAESIVKCRCIQQVILRLLEYSPRLGLLDEALELLDIIQIMEEQNTICPGAITEYDRLVETGARAIAHCVAESSKIWKKRGDEDKNFTDHALVHYMGRVSELILHNWVEHSNQIRISPVESLGNPGYWNEVKSFIQKYGADIFIQQFMGFGNLRAVLHQGVEHFVRSLLRIKQEEGEVEIGEKLISDIVARKISIDNAVSRLEIVFECVAENYSEFVDYNSTTTHSDHGDKLYMLLDMLRVQIGYERLSWKVKPLYWVHDEMIRVGCDVAALLWERSVAKKSVTAAEDFLKQYNRLSEKYGMWLPSVHERLQERFIRPLHIARMCGLVPKAIREAKLDGPKQTFAELHDQIENFAKEPKGVGFEMPEWLNALQEEAMATRTDLTQEENLKQKDVFSSSPHFEQVRLTRAQLDKTLEVWEKRKGQL